MGRPDSVKVRAPRVTTFQGKRSTESFTVMKRVVLVIGTVAVRSVFLVAWKSVIRAHALNSFHQTKYSRNSAK